ncbi:MAG: hypothetical protein H0X33_14460 [Taibaiella sp.]|nr:hypothetical protein [Taibaiella sp.]
MKKFFIVFRDPQAGDNAGGNNDTPVAAKPPTQLLKGEATPEEIAGWKKLYPQGIYSIIVGGKSVLYFKKPGRSELNYANSKRNPDEEFDYYEAICFVTCIGGAKDLLNDEQSFLGIVLRMHTLSIGEPTELVNL